MGENMDKNKAEDFRYGFRNGAVFMRIENGKDITVKFCSGDKTTLLIDSLFNLELLIEILQDCKQEYLLNRNMDDYSKDSI